MNTAIHTDAIGLATLALIAAGWLGSGLLFAFRQKPAGPAAPEAKRARASILGIALQGVAFALVWTVHRSHWWPFPPSTAGEVILAIVAVALTYAGGWWCLRAIRTLGKQWTYEARVTTDHELVTEGPYSVVRNPIYLGLFGLIIGVGLALSTWWALLAAIIIFLVANHIRIRAEESLLRATFGQRFDDYAARVPAFLPRLI